MTGGIWSNAVHDPLVGAILSSRGDLRGVGRLSCDASGDRGGVGGAGGGDGGGVIPRELGRHEAKRAHHPRSVEGVAAQERVEVCAAASPGTPVRSRPTRRGDGAIVVRDGGGGGDDGGDAASDWPACSARLSRAKALAFVTSLSVSIPVGNQVFLTRPRALARPTRNCCCCSPRWAMGWYLMSWMPTP